MNDSASVPSTFPLRVALELPAWLQDEIAGGVHAADAEAQVAFAIRLARRNVQERSGGPFGAAIFDGAGHLVAAGVNRVVPQNCSVAHAEVMAFMAAQAATGRFRLNDDGGRYTLATSAQPCAMCYGASIWAGIDEVLIGARAEDVMALSEFDEGPMPADWVGELEKRGIRVQRDVLRGAACDVFRLYRGHDGAAY